MSYIDITRTWAETGVTTDSRGPAGRWAAWVHGDASGQQERDAWAAKELRFAETLRRGKLASAQNRALTAERLLAETQQQLAKTEADGYHRGVLDGYHAAPGNRRTPARPRPVPAVVLPDQTTGREPLTRLVNLRDLLG